MCVCRIPKGCKKSQNTIQLVGAKGEGFKAPAIKRVMFEGTNQIGMGDVLLVPGDGCNLPGRDFHVQLGLGVLPEERKWKSDFPKEEDEKQMEGVVWAKPVETGAS